ncbi:hypothetical protein DITRI_Ditri06bG0109800 [Diplodiscus trichospermus]
MAIGKVISNKSLNRNEVLKILRGMWSIEVAPCIEEKGNNVCRVSFKTEDHMRKAIEEGLWSVMGSSLALQEWLRDKGRKWVMLKYEKLANFCYACEKLGHQLKNCGQKIEIASQDQLVMKYEAFLRAAPIRSDGLEE